ncbi:hypothetical protein C8J57DRAFT_1603592 [Mycena rebaudengoi]|nr:hypothetical protein C8J57DRAFT_1603592 [Mycena rebaudengoi]
MTVPSPEKSDLKKSDQDDSAVASTSTDALPAYASGSTSTDSPTPLPPGKPTNFLSISRSDGSIKGSYIIDPRIKPPQADETGDAQQNLFLHASNGGIDVDVFVVGDRDVKRRVDLFVRSKNGSITARVHADAARPPISLKVTDANGPITLHLPRSFRGPITILTRNGSVRFSKPLSAQLTQLGEAQNTQALLRRGLSRRGGLSRWRGGGVGGRRAGCGGIEWRREAVV